jgi:lipoprotein-anchoring transpeptidase ErfK/SrfK
MHCSATVLPMRPSVSALAVGLALVASGCDEKSGPPTAAVRLGPPPIEQIRNYAARVLPRTTVVLRTKPNWRGRILARVGPRTEFGSPQTLSIVLRKGPWVAVRSSELGNRQLGWVKADTLRPLKRTRRIEVDLSDRTLTLIESRNNVLRTESVAIGSPDTPTPPGSFFVTDKLPGPEFGRSYGCCILALSGRQPNLPQGWSGGDRLAIHGTPTPDFGDAVTNGCLHLPQESLERLMREVPLGTPVEIRT